MGDKTYRHPVHPTDGNEDVPSSLRDESDGTYSPVERVRLEGWDGQNWIRVRVNAKGAVSFDRGNAGAETGASIDLSGATANAVILAVPSTSIVHVTAIMVALSNAATQSPGVYIKIGTAIIARHPGIPAGGGFAMTDIDVASGNADDDVLISCDNPGGTLSATVHYWLE